MLKVRNLKDLKSAVSKADVVRVSGRVTRVVGTVIEGEMPDSMVGQMCHLYPDQSRTPILAEVVGFQGSRVILMPLGEMRGLRPDSRIETLGASPTVKVGPGLLGRVLDGMAEPLDGGPHVQHEKEMPLYADPINPFERKRIDTPLDVGVRAINGLATICLGQRIAIMAGSGVGKSTLLGMMARHTTADVNVIGLIGERGRELKDFLVRDLGEEGLKRSVVVTATSDTPPLLRVRAAFVATAVAEYFRSQGLNVLFMMDSVTRFAMAQREVGLAAGEPPTSKGYTPSVFSLLPRLLERAGMCREGERGCITGIYTVLVEGDDMNEPIADAVRSILDGHIVLSRKMAERNHYPAIDILASVSRLMSDVVGPDHMRFAGRALALLAAYRDAETLINIGAYVRGSNRQVDTAIEMMDEINAFLRQPVAQRQGLVETVKLLEALATRKVDTGKALTPAQIRPQTGAAGRAPEGR
jgi:flagellum-specific ATP synthase